MISRIETTASLSAGVVINVILVGEKLVENSRLTSSSDSASFRILFGLEDRFEALSGVPVFDTQNDLTVAILAKQLLLYTGDAHTAYSYFAAFDWVFPSVSALFLAVLWTLLLRINSGWIAQYLLHRNLPLLPFLATLCDWAENTSLLIATSGRSLAGQSFLAAVIVCKRLKLLSLALISLVSVFLVVLLIAYTCADVWRKYAKSPIG